jgi:hypothetical protein
LRGRTADGFGTVPDMVEMKAMGGKCWRCCSRLASLIATRTETVLKCYRLHICEFAVHGSRLPSSG